MITKCPKCDTYNEVKLDKRDDGIWMTFTCKECDSDFISCVFPFGVQNADGVVLDKNTLFYTKDKDLIDF